jgi:hypothetical protein
MAIRVVQGLIDVGRSDGGGSSPFKGATSKAVADRDSFHRQPQFTTSAQTTSVLARTATTVAASVGRSVSDAAVSAVRSRSISGEQKPLRDPKDAEKVAATVVERVGIEDEGGGTSHGRLKPEGARLHFQ